MTRNGQRSLQPYFMCRDTVQKRNKWNTVKSKEHARIDENLTARTMDAE